MRSRGRKDSRNDLFDVHVEEARQDILDVTHKLLTVPQASR